MRLTGISKHHNYDEHPARHGRYAITAECISTWELVSAHSRSLEHSAKVSAALRGRSKCLHHTNVIMTDALPDSDVSNAGLTPIVQRSATAPIDAFPLAIHAPRAAPRWCQEYATRVLPSTRMYDAVFDIEGLRREFDSKTLLCMMVIA